MNKTKFKKCLNCKRVFETEPGNDGQDVCSTNCLRAYVIRETAKRHYYPASHAASFTAMAKNAGKN